MVWPLRMKHRRQSQSPTSADSSSPRKAMSFFSPRQKRRNVRKDSSGTVTEATESIGSFSSDRNDSAAWRVENIRSAPPRSEDWWKEENSDDDDDNSDEGYEAVVASSGQVSFPHGKKFHNCGLETWLKAREEWNRRTVETLPPKPTPAEYNQLVRGLMKHSALRYYELPRRMALSDLIDVHNDIWEGQGS